VAAVCRCARRRAYATATLHAQAQLGLAGVLLHGDAGLLGRQDGGLGGSAAPCEAVATRLRRDPNQNPPMRMASITTTRMLPPKVAAATATAGPATTLSAPIVIPIRAARL
jgi:hypothetical protein